MTSGRCTPTRNLLAAARKFRPPHKGEVREISELYRTASARGILFHLQRAAVLRDELHADDARVRFAGDTLLAQVLDDAHEIRLTFTKHLEREIELAGRPHGAAHFGQTLEQFAQFFRARTRTGF